MKAIIHLLQTTPERYQKIQFDSYITWCQS